MKKKLCIDCRFVKTETRKSQNKSHCCTRDVKTNPVDGSLFFPPHCERERKKTTGPCGPEGKYFQHYASRHFTLTLSPEVGAAMMVCTQNIKNAEQLLKDIKKTLRENQALLGELINKAQSVESAGFVHREPC